MSMVTRCPSCRTLFRVTPQQLQARDGWVRCGRCMTVFDGFATLAILPESTPGGGPAGAATQGPTVTVSAPGMPAPTPPQVQPAEGSTAAAASEAVPESSAPPGFEFEPIEPASSAVQKSKPAAAAPFESLQAAAHSEPRPAVPPLQTIKGDARFLQQARGTSRRSPRLWAIGSFLLLAVLGVQLVYVYRSELAARYPVMKPALGRLCELAGCTVPALQRPRLLSIEASDLQSIDPARPGLIQVTATLRNNATHEVGYPAIDLVLTNTREHTLARRIVLPGEYLDRGRDPGMGIPPKGEITIRFHVDTGDLGASGFRLDLLAAPLQ